MPSLSEASGPRTAPKNHFQNFPENLFNSNRAAKQFKNVNFYHNHVVTCKTEKYQKYNSTRFVLKSVENTKLALSCMR